MKPIVSRLVALFSLLLCSGLLAGVVSLRIVQAATADIADFYGLPDAYGKRAKVLRINSSKEFFPVTANTGKVGTTNNPFAEGNFAFISAPTVCWGYQTVSANTTLTKSSPTFTHCTNGSATVTLAGNPPAGFPQAIRSSGVNNVTVASSDNIDGSSSLTVPGNTTYVFQYSGSTWKRILP